MNRIVIVEDIGRPLLIVEDLFNEFFERIDDRSVRFRNMISNGSTQEHNEHRDNTMVEYRYGDWSKLNTMVTGYYRLVV